MKRLYRRRKDALLGGVCGGIAEYLGVDPTLVRVVFAVLAVASGIGVLIYFLLWLLIPQEGEAPSEPRDAVRAGAEEIADRAKEFGKEVRASVARRDTGLAIAVAAILIFLGVSLLLRNLGVWWAWWLRFDVLGPIVLIAVGLALLWRLPRRG
ncbi:PspC domain-containing protein [Candidatus Bipolaricaulota bacterium]|nr:PspC domain-containing protein [Candidatus Bipolaricaulota bacterium]